MMRFYPLRLEKKSWRRGGVRGSPRECLCRRRRRRRRRCVCLKRPFPRVLMAFEFHPRSAIRPRVPLSHFTLSPIGGSIQFISEPGRKARPSIASPSEQGLSFSWTTSPPMRDIFLQSMTPTKGNTPNGDSLSKLRCIYFSN